MIADNRLLVTGPFPVGDVGKFDVDHSLCTSIVGGIAFAIIWSRFVALFMYNLCESVCLVAYMQ